MLKITSAHITALGEQQAREFVRRMALHLREVFGQEVAALGEKQLRLFVEKVTARAEEWGIVEEQHVERLLELFVCYPELRSSNLTASLNNIVTFPDRAGAQVLRMLEDELWFGGAD